MIISLGGDGTLISTARNLKTHAIPIMGINLGNLGFTTEFSKSELFDELEQVLKNKYDTYKLNLFSATVFDRFKKIQKSKNHLIHRHSRRTAPMCVVAMDRCGSPAAQAHSTPHLRGTLALVSELLLGLCLRVSLTRHSQGRTLDDSSIPFCPSIFSFAFPPSHSSQLSQHFCACIVICSLTTISFHVSP